MTDTTETPQSAIDPLLAYVRAHDAQSDANKKMIEAFAAYVVKRDQDAAAREQQTDAELKAVKAEMRNVLQALHNVGGQLDQLNKR